MWVTPEARTHELPFFRRGGMTMHLRTMVMAIGLGCAAIVLNSATLGIAAAVAAFLATKRRARETLAALLLAATLGCATVVTTQPALRNIETHPVGLKGRLAGDAGRGLPASVAAALDPTSDVIFTYDERVTQIHDEIPIPVMLFTSTFHLLGVPTGRDEVKAHAELIVARGTREIGRYNGEAEASRIYGLYYGASMLELEDEARKAVRLLIDEALFDDTARLTRQVDASQP
jgi:hypothetical protein